jgi:hypothetical protein
MSVLNTKSLKGLLPVVISGGRPKLAQRQTCKFLPSFEGVTAAPVWIVRESEANDYEDDGHEIVSVPEDWAYEYASSHWMEPDPPEKGGFYGAFVSREYACKIAEERGYWGVLQLDDNIVRLEVFTNKGKETATRNGGLALFVDILAAITCSTNGYMVGAQLSSVASIQKIKTARTGFPYSLFIERLGEAREHWYGPYEDDITHAFQYGTRADGSTALCVDALRYKKESKSKTGMRSQYSSKRAISLHKIFPESAKVTRINGTSNGKGKSRIFHKMSNTAIRNPLRVTDKELFGKVKLRLEELARETEIDAKENIRRKIERHAQA